MAFMRWKRLLTWVYNTMPFTPLHLGIGAFARSVTPHRYFSFQVFFLSQVLIDLQPGLGLLLHGDELHGWTHTYAGALVIALATAILWAAWERNRPKHCDNGHVSPVVLAYTALLGTLSHVWLDSQFHAEMAKITPERMKLWTTGDVATQVDIFCLALFMLAFVIWMARGLTLFLWRRYRQAGARSRSTGV